MDEQMEFRFRTKPISQSKMEKLMPIALRGANEAGEEDARDRRINSEERQAREDTFSEAKRKLARVASIPLEQRTRQAIEEVAGDFSRNHGISFADAKRTLAQARERAERGG